MKLACVAVAVLAFPLMMAGQQRSVTVAPNPQNTTTAGSTSSGFPFPGGFDPAGLFEHFWNDPAIAAELHLTDAQRKQLQDASLNQHLALIDGGADALKALAKMSAILEADQLDDAAYRQQLDALASASGKLVRNVGEIVIVPRHVLSAEQWKKLQALQRAKRAAARTVMSNRQPGARPAEKPNQ